jgi:hypothetical protein
MREMPDMPLNGHRAKAAVADAVSLVNWISPYLDPRLSA